MVARGRSGFRRLALQALNHDQQHHKRGLRHDGMAQVWRHVCERSRLHSVCIRPESKVRLAFQEIKLRGHRRRVGGKLVSRREAEQDDLYILIVVDCPAEDAALRNINFLDQFGRDEIRRIR